MKTIMLIISALLLATQQASATSYFRIGISQEGTNTVLKVQDNPVTIEKVQEFTAKVGAIDKDQMVMVNIDTSTPAESLLTVLKIIKDAGLKEVCILPWPERTNYDMLSIEIMPKTNEFIDAYYGESNPIGDILEEVPLVEPK